MHFAQAITCCVGSLEFVSYQPLTAPLPLSSFCKCPRRATRQQQTTHEPAALPEVIACSILANYSRGQSKQAQSISYGCAGPC